MEYWHALEFSRPSHPVPSIHHQTLLFKSIFEHCLDYAQVASIALASKSFQNSSLSPNFVHNIIVDGNALPLLNSVFHASSSLPLQFVSMLRICGNRDEITEWFESLKSTKYFRKSLQSLRLERCTIWLTPLLSSASSSDGFFSNLKELSIVTRCGDLLGEMEVVFLNDPVQLPSLQSVSMAFEWISQPPPSQQFSIPLAAQIIKLTRFSIEYCEDFPSQLVLENLRQFNNRLKTFSIHEISGSVLDLHTAFEIFGQFSHLTTLLLPRGAEWVAAEDSGESVFRLLPASLTSLDISRCSINLGQADISAIAETLVNLRHLDICGGPLVDEFALEIISSGLLSSCLEELNLASCSGVNDVGMSILSRRCKKLRKLNVTACSQITNQGLKYLSEITSLEDLDLSELQNLRGSDWASSMNLPNLTRLSLSGCRWITLKASDNNLRINIQHNNNLKILNIHGAPFVDDESLKILPLIFPQLSELHIDYCPRITDDGFIGFAASAASTPLVHTLKMIDMSGLTNITNDAVTAVIRGFHRLDELYVMHCEALNNDLFDETIYPEIEKHLERFSKIDIYGTTISPNKISKRRRWVKF